MKHLLADIGPRKGGLHKILTTEEHIFNEDLPVLIHSYAPETLLDDGEWYVLPEFTAMSFKNPFIDMQVPINTTTLNQLAEADYEHIRYLCYEHNNLKYFQKVTQSNFLRKRWFNISPAPKIEHQTGIVLIADEPDAIYDTTNDKIYFKDIARIKSILKGIDSLYREATQGEINNFLAKDFILLSNGYTGQDVKVSNRKRIALITDRLNTLTDERRRQMFEYIQGYCTNVPYSDGKFSITSEDDLKNLLYGIDERYYTTSIGQEKRIANSIIIMGP